MVVGASAGGLPAITGLLGGVSRDVPAAFFVVVHLARHTTSVLPEILSKVGPLPAHRARSGEAIAHGRIYIAPPDNHLLLEPGRIVLGQGPRENRFRPAVDPLFRSAARAYGPRVIGVVLSGTLGDGTDGLRVIKHAGGIAVVQDAEDAAFPGMPLKALSEVDVDYVESAARLGPLIDRLVREHVEEATTMPRERPRPVSHRGRNERGVPTAEPPSPYTCPDCGGSLWEKFEGAVGTHQCHVAHRFTVASLLEGRSDGVETALWSAVGALEEHATLRRNLADRARTRRAGLVATDFIDEAREAEQRADAIRRVLLAPRVTEGRPSKTRTPSRRRAPTASRRRKMGRRRR